MLLEITVTVQASGDGLLPKEAIPESTRAATTYSRAEGGDDVPLRIPH
jgi:hypothetical protein